MIDPVFANISRILERDSKATTYKFALLRGTRGVIPERKEY